MAGPGVKPTAMSFATAKVAKTPKLPTFSAGPGPRLPKVKTPKVDTKHIQSFACGGPVGKDYSKRK